MGCTAKITVGRASGTGFFVAPGQLLTCAHVVASAAANGSTIQVELSTGTYQAEVRALVPSVEGRAVPDPYPYPDIAWLEVEHTEHPCVAIDREEPRIDTQPDALWGYGFTQNYAKGGARGTPITYECEGLTVGADAVDRRWQIKGGQTTGGMSGAPLLNKRTGKVFGYISRTRGATTDLGAWALPLAEVLGGAPALQPLLFANEQYHSGNDVWARAEKKVTTALQTIVIVAWAADASSAAEPHLDSAVKIVEADWAPSVRIHKIEYRTDSTLGQSSKNDVERLVNTARIIIVIADDLSQSAACYELTEAALRAGIDVNILSSRDPGIDGLMALMALEQDHGFAAIQRRYVAEDLIANISSVVNRYLVRVERREQANILGVRDSYGSERSAS
ncbi:serine protease [Streptomyces anulatus]